MIVVEFQDFFFFFTPRENVKFMKSTVETRRRWGSGLCGPQSVPTGFHIWMHVQRVSVWAEAGRKSADRVAAAH